MLRPRLRHRFFVLIFLGIGAGAASLGATPREDPYPMILHMGSVQGVLGESSGGVQARAVNLLDGLRGPNGGRAQGPKRRILLSCGNMWGPSVTSELDGGRLAVALMNRNGFDAMAVGPHDFFGGLETFVGRAEEATFPLLWTNLKLAEGVKGFEKIRRSLRLKAGARNVHVYGIIDPEGMSQWPMWPAELGLEDSRKALEGHHVQGKKGDLQIVLASMAYSRAMVLMDQLPWIDLLFVHPIGTETLPSSTAFCHQLGDGRMILWSACHGALLAELTVEADAGRRFLARPIALAEHEGRDEGMARRIERLETQARQSRGEVLAELTEEEQGAFPRLFVDAMRAAVGAEVAVLQRKAIRIDRPPKTLSRSVIGQAFPFPDRAAMLSVTGKELMAMWKRRAGAGIEGAELVIAGMEEGCGKVLINGRNIDGSQKYRVASTEFIARGGLGILPARPKAIREEKLTEVLGDWFAAQGEKGWRADMHRQAVRPIRRTRATVDASYSRLEFGGSASQYQYDDPNSTFADSDIPDLVGLAHEEFSYSLRLTHVVDRPQSDLTMDFQLRYSRWKTWKTADRASFDITYEDQSCADRGHMFGRFNLTGTSRAPELAGVDRPLFGKMVTGLVWNRGRDAKLFAGLGALRRFSVDGAPTEGGLNLRYTLDRKLASGVNFRTDFDSFFSFGGDGIRTLDWSNQVRVQIKGGLSTLFKTTTYSWRDDTVGSTASRNELFVGLSWDRLFRKF